MCSSMICIILKSICSSCWKRFVVGIWPVIHYCTTTFFSAFYCTVICLTIYKTCDVPGARIHVCAQNKCIWIWKLVCLCLSPHFIASVIFLWNAYFRTENVLNALATSLKGIAVFTLIFTDNFQNTVIIKNLLSILHLNKVNTQ